MSIHKISKSEKEKRESEERQKNYLRRRYGTAYPESIADWWIDIPKVPEIPGKPSDHDRLAGDV